LNKKGFFLRKLLGFLCVLLLLISPQAWSAAIENAYYTIDPLPQTPTRSTPVFLSIEHGHSCAAVTMNQVLLDVANRKVSISLDYVPMDFSAGCPFPRVTKIPLGYLPNADTYQFFLYFDSPKTSSFFDEQNLIGSFDLLVIESNSAAYPEVPAEGSIQSGIGLIQGWACDAKIIEIQIDNAEKLPVAYGSSRKDTHSVCGDDDNGYGMVIAWGLLAKGVHRLKTFVDGIAISDVEFEVAGLDAAFVAGLSGTHLVQDFPAPGESVTLQWREAAQNFIIIEHD